MKRLSIRSLALVALGGAWPLHALATTVIPVSEPEIWSLLAVAAAAGVILKVRNRRQRNKTGGRPTDSTEPPSES